MRHVDLRRVGAAFDLDSGQVSLRLGGGQRAAGEQRSRILDAQDDERCTKGGYPSGSPTEHTTFKQRVRTLAADNRERIAYLEAQPAHNKLWHQSTEIVRWSPARGLHRDVDRMPATTDETLAWANEAGHAEPYGAAAEHGLLICPERVNSLFLA